MASVRDVLRPYVDCTGLEPQDLVALFERPGWRPRCGGTKWAEITRALIALAMALDAGDAEQALVLSFRVTGLRHNFGPLVPARQAWERNAYLRRKWPTRCEDY